MDNIFPNSSSHNFTSCIRLLVSKLSKEKKNNIENYDGNVKRKEE